MDQPKFPKPGDHISIIGRNGSGKTQAGAWHLAGQNFQARPWVILNTKGDELLNEIADFELVQRITLADTPRKPGLYMVTPHPAELEANIDHFLWKIHQRERAGIYIDEGYMVPKNSPAFNAILTQGRSKKISVIILSQRPVELSRFVFSESNFFQVFAIHDKRDQDTIRAFAPIDFTKRLPDYHSVWYDVKRNRLHTFRPVPQRDEILEIFRSKLTRRRYTL